MKRKLFLLSALALMVAGGIFWSCQKDDLINSSDDEMMLKGAPVKVVKITPTLALTWDYVEGNLIITANASLSKNRFVSLNSGLNIAVLSLSSEVVSYSLFDEPGCLFFLI